MEKISFFFSLFFSHFIKNLFIKSFLQPKKQKIENSFTPFYNHSTYLIILLLIYQCLLFIWRVNAAENNKKYNILQYNIIVICKIHDLFHLFLSFF